MSCEMIAEQTYNIIKDDFNIECYSIEVTEDGENGGLIVFGD